MLVDFVRNRTLSFEVLVYFLLQKSNKSYQSNLDDFFENYSVVPSKGALCIARSKLSFKVFKRLNLFIQPLFYKNTNYKKWKGKRVLAVDGSTLQLPDHDSLSSKFSKHEYGSREHFMSRISYLYDVFNGLVIDAQMESLRTSEDTLCKHHLPFIAKGDLAVFDRNYASYQLMIRLMGKGVDFLFSMQRNAWKCVDEFIEEKQVNDKIVTLQVPQKWKKLAATYQVSDTFTIRLLKKKNKKGEIRVYATSLLSQETYSKKAICALYRQRWGIEEAYKLIKTRLEVADFSGRTIHAVQQDFYAKTMLLSLASSLRFNLKPKIKGQKTRKQEHTQPRIAQLNYTYSLGRVKKIIQNLYWELSSIQKAVDIFIEKVESKVEYSRSGQYFERKIDTKQKKKHAMSYKVV